MYKTVQDRLLAIDNKPGNDSDLNNILNTINRPESRSADVGPGRYI
jgi:hypothetical protein